METVEVLIIGAGVVGLAIARRLALAGREVVVVEAEGGFGQGTSSRNSEVIHAGIYYPHNSLMAHLCIAGRKALYAYCEARAVEHKRCGKMIVATNEAETDRLRIIASHARANGVEDIIRLDKDEIRRMEPNLSACAALHSRSTGIIDSHAYMRSLAGDAEAAGASFAYRTPFERADTRGRLTVHVGGTDPQDLCCRWLINAAGLHAPALAHKMHDFPRQFIPQAYFAKGNYFTLAKGRVPFSRLIYPVPIPGGLGVHLTLDLAGAARFGPDVEWITDIDYSVVPERAEDFYAAIRRYWPGLPDGALAPAYAGIRPKIVPPSVAKQDFVISGPMDHGATGIVQLFGIESPGLTSSLAIADHVAAILDAAAARG